MATIYGNAASKFWKTRLDYSISETNTTVTIYSTLYLYFSQKHTHTFDWDRPSYLSCDGVQEDFYPTGNQTKSAGGVTAIGGKTFTINKSDSARTVTLTASIKHYSGDVKGTSTASVSIGIGKTLYAVTYNANEGSNPPASQIKTHGEELTLSSVIPIRDGYDFVSWNTAADGSGTSYASGGTMPANVNQDTTLYAIWHISYAPPTVENLRAYRTTQTSTGRNPDVVSDGTRCYADFVMTASVDPDAVVNGITFSFGDYTVAASQGVGGQRYAYTPLNTEHLLPTQKETVTIIISVTDYLGNNYSYQYSTYISTENYVFDAFKGTYNSEEYAAFALGGVARDFNSPPTERHMGGNFDCYMSPTFFTMIGEIKMWAGNTIPQGWLLCDGSEISKTAYPKLYAAIGDLWGNPSSSSNFKLPDFTGKVPVGHNVNDTDFDAVGETGGSKTVTLTVEQMPSHNHGNNYEILKTTSGSGNRRYGPYDYGAGSGTAWTSWSGGGQAHDNMPPYAVVKYIICAR